MLPKNRIYCPEAGKPKLLFATEKKAQTYIKFNAEEIEAKNGFAPCRAYFCQCCAGWHVTHNKGYTAGPASTNKVISKFREQERYTAEQKAAENRFQSNALKQLQDLLAVFTTAERKGESLSDYQIAHLLSIYSEYEDDCKAKGTKKRIKYYFSKYNIEL